MEPQGESTTKSCQKHANRIILIEAFRCCFYFCVRGPLLRPISVALQQTAHGAYQSCRQTQAFGKEKATRNDASPLASQTFFPGCDTCESSIFKPRRPKFRTHGGLSAASVELSPAFCCQSRGAGYGSHNQRRRCRACRWSRASPLHA